MSHSYNESLLLIFRGLLIILLESRILILSNCVLNGSCCSIVRLLWVGNSINVTRVTLRLLVVCAIWIIIRRWIVGLLLLIVLLRIGIRSILRLVHLLHIQLLPISVIKSRLLNLRLFTTSRINLLIIALINHFHFFLFCSFFFRWFRWSLILRLFIGTESFRSFYLWMLYCLQWLNLLF